MRKCLIVVFIFSCHISFSQFNVGMSLLDVKKEIKTYRQNITITQEYYSEINSIVLKYTYLNSEIINYFMKDKCYLEVIIPSKISAFNMWKKMFNENLIRYGEDKWVSHRGGVTTIFELEYFASKDINIIRIFEEK